ncbi:hypothetical protein HD554DRAFT_2328589 [Boletus coccyginus]|nr:hypothetical protein HD554DRAFT_2328589 [Boletus coccyginus]
MNERRRRVGQGRSRSRHEGLSIILTNFPDSRFRSLSLPPRLLIGILPPLVSLGAGLLVDSAVEPRSRRSLEGPAGCEATRCGPDAADRSHRIDATSLHALLHICLAALPTAIMAQIARPARPYRDAEHPAMRWCQRLPNAIPRFEESVNGNSAGARPHPGLLGVTRAQEVEPVPMANIPRRPAHVWYGLILAFFFLERSSQPSGRLGHTRGAAVGRDVPKDVSWKAMDYMSLNTRVSSLVSHWQGDGHGFEYREQKRVAPHVRLQEDSRPAGGASILYPRPTRSKGQKSDGTR